MNKRSLLMPVRLTHAQRTTVAYMAMSLSVLCVLLSAAITTFSYLQHVLVDDIDLLVRGYHASDVLLMLAIVGSVTGTVYAIGSYVCYRATASRDRKAYKGWLIAYIVTLLKLITLSCFAIYQCCMGLQKPSVERSLETDLLAALKNYSYLVADKSRIDRMHMNFKCCGSREFRDWWYIQWCTRWVNPYDVRQHLGRNGLYLVDDVPFSCCDPSVGRPCVHQAMRDRARHAKYPVGNRTLYKAGCASALQRHVASVGTWLLFGFVTMAALTLVVLVGCRYLQTSTAAAVYAGDVTLPARGYLWSSGPRSAPGIRAPPPTPATQPSSPRPAASARRRKVAKTDKKSVSKTGDKGVISKRRNKNKSNRDVNNSAALCELVDDLLADSPSHWDLNSDLELIVDQLIDRSRATSGRSPSTVASSPPLSETVVRPPCLSDTDHRSGTSVPSVGLSSPSSPSSPPSNLNTNARTSARRSLRSTRVVKDADAQSLTDSRMRSPSPVKSPDSARHKPLTDSLNPLHRKPSGRQCRSASRSGAGQIGNAGRTTPVSIFRGRGRTSDNKNGARNGKTLSSADDLFVHDPVMEDQVKYLHVRRKEQKVHSRSGCQRRTSQMSFSSSADQTSRSSRRNTSQRSSTTSTARSSRSSVSEHGSDKLSTTPANMFSGSPVLPDTEDRSSDWSTISCRTVSQSSGSESRRTAVAAGIRAEDKSAGDSLSFNKNRGIDAASSHGSIENHKSSPSYLKNSSKAVENCHPSMSSIAYLALPNWKRSERPGLVRTANADRSPANSWSTVSYQTLSRPPSSEFRGETVVDEENPASATSIRQAGELACNMNYSSCNSLPFPNPRGSPEMRRQPSCQSVGVSSSAPGPRCTARAGYSRMRKTGRTASTLEWSEDHKLNKVKYRSALDAGRPSLSLRRAILDAVELEDHAYCLIGDDSIHTASPRRATISGRSVGTRQRSAESRATGT